jgi:hypothetical protein
MILRIFHFIHRNRLKRWIVGGALAAAIIACGGIIMAAALAKATPTWWPVVRADDPAMVALASEVERKFENDAYENRPAKLDGDVWRSEPWRLKLTAREASAWLMLRLPLWLANQDERFRWPPEIQGVQVRFGAGTITVGASVTSSGGSAATAARSGLKIVSATILPRLDEQGRLFVPVQGVSVGRLVVPASWVLDGARDSRYMPRRVWESRESEGLLKALLGEEALLDRAVLRLGDGRRVRLVGFTLENGGLAITCQTERPGSPEHHEPAGQDRARPGPGG